MARTQCGFKFVKLGDILSIMALSAHEASQLTAVASATPVLLSGYLLLKHPGPQASSPIVIELPVLVTARVGAAVRSSGSVPGHSSRPRAGRRLGAQAPEFERSLPRVPESSSQSWF